MVEPALRSTFVHVYQHTWFLFCLYVRCFGFGSFSRVVSRRSRSQSRERRREREKEKRRDEEKRKAEEERRKKEEEETQRRRKELEDAEVKRYTIAFK